MLLILKKVLVNYLKDSKKNSRFGGNHIRIGTVAEDDFLFFADEDCKLAERYADKIEMLHHYDADEEVEKTREMSFLDGCRHEECIDDVMVFLVKEGLKPEGCWARIIGLGDHFFMATLLNEPDQNFGYHQGEKITFFVQKTEDERIICISDMNPSAKIYKMEACLRPQ